MKQFIFSGIFFLIAAINFGQTPDAHSYAIANGTSQCITEHGVTRYVTNVNCGATIFISALTAAEWTSFYTYYPACVTVASSCCTLLVNSVPTHTNCLCTSLGGTVASDGTYNMCKFATSCPSGWTQYQNWCSTTAVTTSGTACSYGCCYGVTNTVTNPGHGWSNNDTHYPLSGTVCGIGADACWSDSPCGCCARFGYGAISYIGCY